MKRVSERERECIIGMGMEDEISPVSGDGVTETVASEEQQAAGVGILLQIMMLVLSFVLGHVLRRKKIYVVPEASASLLIGLLVGALANISNTQSSIRAWFNFHDEFFFLFLLPPIILYPFQPPPPLLISSFSFYTRSFQNNVCGFHFISFP